MNSSLKLISLTLFASSVESLLPDGGLSNRVYSFAQQPGMQYGYGGSDMSLQNDFYGVPSFAQQGGFGGGGFGREEFGMPSFQGMGRMGGDFPPRGDFGRGSMAMGARRGVLPDEDFGLNAEMGSANRRPGGRSMTSNQFGGRPSYHHAMSPGGGFQPNMSFNGMPMGGPQGMGGGYGREEFRQMGRNGAGQMNGQGMGFRREEFRGAQGMGMGGGYGRDEFRPMGRNGGGEMNGQRMGMGGEFGRQEFRPMGRNGGGEMNGQRMGMGGEFGRQEFRGQSGGRNGQRSGPTQNWK